MWWLDPWNLKRILGTVVNHVLGPYVETLDLEDVKNGIEKGHLTLRNLRLNKGPLERFLLPVQFVHGHVGKFTLIVNWQNLGNEPILVEIEDVHLLVAPSSDLNTDTAKQRERTRFTKLERLRLADLLCWQFEAKSQSADTPLQHESLHTLIASIVGSLEVSVRNVHLRYEDMMSVPKELFAVGITLAEFTSTSVEGYRSFDDIKDVPEETHKSVQLESLALYLDTNTTSLGHLSHSEFVSKSVEYITHPDTPGRQYILKPVNSQDKIRLNKGSHGESPLFDIQLVVDDIFIAFNDSQYRSIISFVDMYHCYLRRRRFRRYMSQYFAADNAGKTGPAALWRLATGAIMSKVRDRQRRWTWTWFAERRDERKRYIDVWARNEAGILDPKDVPVLEALEDKLSYDDLRLYRLIAKSQSNSESKSILNPTVAQQSGHTLSCASGGSPVNTRVAVKLACGSLVLKTDPLGRNTDIVSITLDKFHVTFRQRPNSREIIVTLASVVVRDGSDSNAYDPLVIYVKDDNSHHASEPQATVSSMQLTVDKEPFFVLKVESDPRDPQAESVVTIHTHDLEMVYRRSYLEALHEFFKLPDTQSESFKSLLDWLMRSSPFFRWASVAGQTLRTLFSLRVQDESQATTTEVSTFVLQLSASVRARVVPSTPTPR